MLWALATHAPAGGIADDSNKEARSHNGQHPGRQPHQLWSMIHRRASASFEWNLAMTSRHAHLGVTSSSANSHVQDACMQQRPDKMLSAA